MVLCFVQRLIDFGFAKILSEDHKGEYKTYTNCGTLCYSPPEVLLNKGYSWSIDLWGYAVMLFEMATGRTPFGADDPFKVQQRILSGSIRWPKKMDKTLKDLCKRMFVHEVDGRLGCKREGLQAIKDHKFFDGTEWMKQLKRELKPPYQPDVKAVDDTSKFPQYPESLEDSSPELPQKVLKQWTYILDW